MEYTVTTITDWWIFWATLGAGILSVFGTFLAVWLTNKATAKQYKTELARQREERESERKEKAMVIVKPRILRNTYEGIVDMIVMRGLFDRILLFSGNDGFGFINHSEIADDGKQYAPIWRFLFIENDSSNNITSVKLTTHSKLETCSNEITEYSTSNFVAFLRSKESLSIRLENLEQWKKLKEASEFTFEATIEYLTSANQQVCYKYKVKIKNYKTEVLRDEYTIIDDVTLPGDNKPTVHHNFQDDAPLDRSEYAWRKIGAAQLRGLNYFSQPSRPDTVDFDALLGIVKNLWSWVQSAFAIPASENTIEELAKEVKTDENTSQ